MVAYETQLALFFRDTVNIARIFDSFHDIRMHPRIRLKDILVSVFLMPYWGIKALLQLDIHLRTPQMLRLAPKEPSRRLGVIDGSQMGDHYLVAALLCGRMNYPVLAYGGDTPVLPLCQPHSGPPSFLTGASLWPGLRPNGESLSNEY